MPQQSLLPDHPPMHRLLIEITDCTLDLYDQTQVDVKMALAGDQYRTIWSCRLGRIETDYLDTMIEQVTHAWAYGETSKDIVRAAIAVRKLAKVHARAHERS